MLHNFGAANIDGSLPSGPIVLSGNDIFGNTAFSDPGTGIAYMLDITTLAETKLHTFGSKGDASVPVGLILGGSTLFGASGYGGDNKGHHHYGTVFTLDGSSGAVDLLYSFTGGTDGARPNEPPIYLHGKLYGIAQFGGVQNKACSVGPGGCGTIYEVNPAKKKKNFTLLYGFAGDSFGYLPSTLTNNGGTFYGMTVGGTLGFGTVFKLTTP